MGENTIAGVMRAGAYSPNNIDNDAAIFNAVVKELRQLGFKVNIYSEEEFRCADISEEVVVSMCREPESVSKLIELEREGRLVINSGYGVRNCNRESMTLGMQGFYIPYPESIIVDTSEDVAKKMNQRGFTRVWVKRGDSHAVVKDDVCYCQNASEVQEVLRRFESRGIRRAVINRHLEGDLIKFYGVSGDDWLYDEVGEDWFYWFYPADKGHSKYGHEVVNGPRRGFPFSEERLRRICQKASDILSVKIYGGDAIVGADGSIQIIDFNDWPSFAPCRDEAAPYIARCVVYFMGIWRKEKGGDQ